jgi:hypothetical protein
MPQNPRQEVQVFICVLPGIGKINQEPVFSRHEYEDIPVGQYKMAWPENFQFISSMKVDADVSCLHMLTQDGNEGMSRHVAVGDVTG